MARFKYWLLGIGTVMASIGFLCLPIGYGASPYRNTSFFNNLADLGAFLNIGLIMLAIGGAMVLISLLIREKDQK